MVTPADDYIGLICSPRARTAILSEVFPKFTRKLKSTSPLISKGIDLFATFAVSSGGKDYRGTLLPQGGKYEIGALEYVI